jgi:hypothetical protein
MTNNIEADYLANIGFYCARVEVLHAPRTMSDFIVSAGLGITGIGVPEVLKIDWKPGELVNGERVRKVTDAMVAESECQNTAG